MQGSEEKGGSCLIGIWDQTFYNEAFLHAAQRSRSPRLQPGRLPWGEAGLGRALTQL